MFQKEINPPKYLDQMMREHLAESLAYILETFKSQFKIDILEISEMLNKIRSEPVLPGVFARYFDLVFALNEKNMPAAQQMVTEILVFALKPVEFSILPYRKDRLGDDYERFRRLIFTGYAQTPPVFSPTPALYEGHLKKLKQALVIIETVDDAIYQEISALIFQVIVTANPPEFNGVSRYAGASSQMAWGCVFINADQYFSLYQTVEFYVHEVTHCVLFGYSCNEPLVLNPLSESYQSPLRSDPRPMDGIYHATLVCARLALFMQQWLTHGADDAEHTVWLKQQHKTYLHKFFDGATVIEQYGQLSEKGQTLFENAKACLVDFL